MCTLILGLAAPSPLYRSCPLATYLVLRHHLGISIAPIQVVEALFHFVQYLQQVVRRQTHISSYRRSKQR